MLPSSWSFKNFRTAWTSVPFSRFFLNSLGTTLIATAVKVILGVTTAYALVFLRFPGRRLAMMRGGIRDADFVVLEHRETGFNDAVRAFVAAHRPVRTVAYRGVPLVEIYARPRVAAATPATPAAPVPCGL